MRTATAIVAAGLGLAGCNANWTTVDRRTDLPFAAGARGVAIHLDAKQRLAFAKDFGIVCAEPSPDALSTLAASFGASLAIPEKAAGSLAGQFSEAGGSIGLRTQSITLMRDMLYRICEAYYGKALNGVQVTHLLGRSQDLTAAVLAIEQLTGAVAAKQVILSGSASGSAAAGIALNDALLESAKATEAQRAAELSKAEADLKAAQNARPSDAAKVQQAQDEVNVKMADLESAKKTREGLEKTKGSALAQAAASGSAGGVFAAPLQAPNVQMTADTAKVLAEAVSKIVSEMVEKDHTTDSCLAMLTDVTEIADAVKRAAEAAEAAKADPSPDKQAAAAAAQAKTLLVKGAYDRAIDFCKDLLTQRSKVAMEIALIKAKAEAARIEAAAKSAR